MSYHDKGKKMIEDGYSSLWKVTLIVLQVRQALLLVEAVGRTLTSIDYC
jgi:hypothetical protein